MEQMKHIFWFQHKYKSIDLKHGKGNVNSNLTFETIERNVDVTLILKRCSCGKKKTEIVRGHWTPGMLGIKR